MFDIRIRRELRLIARTQSDPDFRAALIADPRATIEREGGIRFPAAIQVRLIEERPGEMVFVLPMDPGGKADLRGLLDDVELESVAGGKGETHVEQCQNNSWRCNNTENPTPY